MSRPDAGRLARAWIMRGQIPYDEAALLSTGV
jgi:hypothetical protein